MFSFEASTRAAAAVACSRGPGDGKEPRLGQVTPSPHSEPEAPQEIEGFATAAQTRSHVATTDREPQAWPYHWFEGLPRPWDEMLEVASLPGGESRASLALPREQSPPTR